MRIAVIMLTTLGILFNVGARPLPCPGEDVDKSTAAGRPLGTEYSDPLRKIAFMDMHNIQTSVLSLANPWLEFVSGSAASSLATALNDDMQAGGVVLVVACCRCGGIP